MTGTPYIWRSQIPELAPFSAGERRFICRVAVKLLRRDDIYYWGFIQMLGLGWIALWGLITLKLCANSKGFESLVLAATPVGIGLLGLQMRAHILHTRLRPIIQEIVAGHGERIHKIRSRFEFKDYIACSSHVARHLLRTIRMRSTLPFLVFVVIVILVIASERPYVLGGINIRLVEPGYLATNRETSEQIGFVSRMGSDIFAVLLEIEHPFHHAPHKYVALRKIDGQTLGEFDAETLKSSPFARIELVSIRQYFK